MGKTNIELITLCGDKSLIRNHLPDKLGVEAVDRIMKEETKAQLQSFGLFDNSSPNYSTYYPEVTANDLNPSDAEFIFPVYRLLSAVVIKPKSLAIDFTNEAVLKASIPLLVGASVMIDHEMISGNIQGVIKNAYWQDAYTTNDGVRVPGGINGVMMIDGKSNPRIARLINMNPPALHSSSVTVQFAWHKSHPKMSDQEFANQLGTVDKQGNRVMKVANNIMMYYENSLVPHGADPFAKKVENGQIVLAKQASQLYKMSFSDNNPYYTQRQGEVLPINIGRFSFSDIEHNDTTHNNINPETMEFTELITSLGLDATTIADESALLAHLSAQLSEVTTLKASITEKDGTIATLTAELEGKTATITSLTAERDAALLFKVQAEAATTSIRTEAKKFYNLLKGDKADTAIITSLDNGAIEAVTAQLADYKTQYEAQVPLTCQKCHSTDVTRASSAAGGGEGEGKVDYRDKIRNSARLKKTETFIEK